jgi:beta-phosphoglucomutase-like phosphatase (HAD superfamily)
MSSQETKTTTASFSGVLFDFDGTLVDSTPAIIKHWHKYALFSFHSLKSEVFNSFVTTDLDSNVLKLTGAIGTWLTNAELAKKLVSIQMSS